MPQVIRIEVHGIDTGEFIVSCVDRIEAESARLHDTLNMVAALADVHGDMGPVVSDTLPIFHTYVRKVQQAFRELELAGELVAEAHGIRPR